MRKRPIRRQSLWRLEVGRNEMMDPPQASAWGMEEDAMPHPLGWGPTNPSLLPPDLAFHLFRFEVGVLLCPEAGRQVLPAAVGEGGADGAGRLPGGDAGG